MTRTNLFPTPLWEEEDCGVDLQPLVDFCYHVKKEDPEGRRASNGGGGWQSSDFRVPFLLTTPLKELHDRLDKFVLSLYSIKNKISCRDEPFLYIKKMFCQKTL